MAAASLASVGAERRDEPVGEREEHEPREDRPAESRPTLGSVSSFAIPGLSEIPVVGGKGHSNGSVFSQPLVVYLGLGLAILVAWILRRTHLGLNVRAAGDKPGALDAAGVSVVATRSWAVLFAGGALLLVPVAVLAPPGWLATPRGALVALHLGLLATAAAYALFAAGLRRVTVATAATMSLAEPLTAAVLGVALLGERLTVAGLAGAALLVAGLLLLAGAPTPATPRRPRRRRGT